MPRYKAVSRLYQPRNDICHFSNFCRKYHFWANVMLRQPCIWVSCGVWGWFYSKNFSRPTFFFCGELISSIYFWRKSVVTLPTAEILSGKNARAFMVCGFLMKSFKKNILKIWKKLWELFGSYLLNSTANPAHFHQNWAGLAVPFSRQLLNGSQDFFLF